MRRNMTAGILSAVVGGSLMLAMPIVARAGDSDMPKAMPQATHADFSDRELKSYAEAVVEVGTLSAKWRRRLNKTDDTQKAEKMRNNAHQQLAQAIRDHDISVDKYKQISRAVRRDPKLKAKVMSYLQEDTKQQ